MKIRFFRGAFWSGLLILTALSVRAQGPAGQPPSGSQPWMQFEKELGLQTTYACDMTMQTMGMNMDMHVVRAAGKTRTEMTLPFMNLRMVALEFPENGQKASYSVFPDQKKYVRNDEAAQARALAQSAAATASAATAPPKLEDLGTENYEGEACLKRRAILGQQGATSELIMLLSPRQKNMPVKMTINATVPATADRPPLPILTVVLFKNYDFSAPADSLFALPADYAKAANMQEIMMASMPDLGALMKQMPPPPANPQ